MRKFDIWVSLNVSVFDIIIEKGKNEEIKMNKKDDKSTWVIGGTTLIGVGVGFIFLKTSVLMFVASIIIGIGVGLVIAPLISIINRQK